MNVNPLQNWHATHSPKTIDQMFVSHIQTLNWSSILILMSCLQTLNWSHHSCIGWESVSYLNTKSISCYVKIHPEKYLIHSFNINSKIEGLDKDTFQIIPQRNNIVPKNILLNTSGIADYICNQYFKLFDYAESEIVLHCKNMKNMYGVEYKN